MLDIFADPTLAAVRPMAPFFAAGLVIAWGINSAQNSMMAGMLAATVGTA
jgi:hypothetical protein